MCSKFDEFGFYLWVSIFRRIDKVDKLDKFWHV